MRWLSATTRERRIITPSRHEGDNQDAVIIDREMNDVRKTLESAGSKSIGGDSKLQRVIANLSDGGQVLAEEVVAQPATLVIVPGDSGDNIIFYLRAVRQLSHQRRLSIRRMSSS